MTDKGSGGNRGHQPAPQTANKGYQPQSQPGKVQGGYQAPGGGKPSAPTTGSGVSGGGGKK